MILAVSGSGKEVRRTLCAVWGKEEGMRGELWVDRCVSLGTQRQNLASVINWFHEAEPEPDPHEARMVCPSPFCARESRHKDFPGSSVHMRYERAKV